jgi:hypothetical protein
MSYSAVEALALTQVRAVSGYNTTNTSRGKWGILNSGKSTDGRYAILKPGPFVTAQGAMAANVNTWRTIIQVWRRYKDDGDTLTNLEADVELLRVRFAQYRKLADTTNKISDASIVGGGEVQERWTKGGNGPAWLMQEIYLDTQEFDEVTYAE